MPSIFSEILLPVINPRTVQESEPGRWHEREGANSGQHEVPPLLCSSQTGDKARAMTAGLLLRFVPTTLLEGEQGAISAHLRDSLFKTG